MKHSAPKEPKHTWLLKRYALLTPGLCLNLLPRLLSGVWPSWEAAGGWSRVFTCSKLKRPTRKIPKEGTQAQSKQFRSLLLCVFLKCCKIFEYFLCYEAPQCFCISEPCLFSKSFSCLCFYTCLACESLWWNILLFYLHYNSAGGPLFCSWENKG